MVAHPADSRGQAGALAGWCVQATWDRPTRGVRM